MLTSRSPSAAGRRAATLALLVVALSSLGGCAGRLGQAGVVEGERLDMSKALLVLAAEDALDEAADPIPATGLQVSMAVRQALGALGIQVLGGQTTERDDGLAEARLLGCSMVVQPLIVEWREAGVDWVHGGDRVILGLRFYAVDDGALVAWGEDGAEDDSMRSGRQSTYRLVGPLVESMLERIFGTDVVPPLDEP